MTVLVDTSIWVRFLAKRLEQPQVMRALLMNQFVAGHEFVYGELLIGDKGGRLPLLTAYLSLPMAPPVSHREVVSFVRTRRLHGRGAGWIDIHLVASAMVAGFQFWTADPRLSQIAEEVGIAYDAAR